MDDGTRVTIFTLVEDAYQEQIESTALPAVTGTALTVFV